MNLLSTYEVEYLGILGQQPGCIDARFKCQLRWQDALETPVLLTVAAVPLVSVTCMELLSTVRAMFTSLIAVTIRFAKSRLPEL